MKAACLQCNLFNTIEPVRQKLFPLWKPIRQKLFIIDEPIRQNGGGSEVFRLSRGNRAASCL